MRRQNHTPLPAIVLLALTFLLTAGCEKQLAAAPPATTPTTRPTAKSPFTAIADHPAKLGDHFIERLTNDTEKFELAFIVGGEFLLGSPNDEPGHDKNEGPQHRVSVNPFWVARHETTADLVMLWVVESGLAQRAAAGQKIDTQLTPTALRAGTQFPSGKPFAPLTFHTDQMDKFPAVTVTAYGAQQFCLWLSARTGHYYRLPTEAEWEYACRAGSTTPYFFGADPSKLSEYAWFAPKAVQKFYPNDPQPVAKTKPNAWGLYDMIGNVGEYVLDDWCDNYEQYAGKTTADPWRNHDNADYAIVRGGDSDSEPSILRSASRRKMRQMKEANYESPIFDATGPDGVEQTGFRIVSPLQFENDGRESCIPSPKYPKF